MNNIKTARIAAGLTQQAMSEKMGIPKRTIENWEQGSRQCPGWTERLIIEKLEGTKMTEYCYNGYTPYGAGERLIIDSYASDEFMFNGNATEECIKNGARFEIVDGNNALLHLSADMSVNFVKR